MKNDGTSVAKSDANQDDEPRGAAAAITAGLRLDAALRGFLAEQGTKHLDKRELWRLVGGTLRLRLTAHSIAALPRNYAEDVGTVRATLSGRAETLGAFYEQLGALLDRPRGQPIAMLTPPTFNGDDALDPGSPDSRDAIWLSEHLDHLSEHLAELVPPATQLAEIRRRPWWR